MEHLQESNRLPFDIGMESNNLKNIVEEVVDTAIIKLKLAGLMKDGGAGAYEKTEQILRSYPQLKKSYSEDGTAKKFVDIVDNALKELWDDLYYDIIPMMYFEGQSREAIAEYFDTSTTTISRNKRRLLEKLKVMIFADDVIHELFL